MDELVVSSLEFGDSVPILDWKRRPELNDSGLWIEMRVSYSGSFSMTVDTKINLMKIKKPPTGSESSSQIPEAFEEARPNKELVIIIMS
jgi:hypothetical protein